MKRKNHCSLLSTCDIQAIDKDFARSFKTRQKCNRKYSMHIFPSFKLFSEIQFADFTKPWQQIPEHSISYFLGPNKKVRPHICELVLHISIFPDSLAAPCLALDVQTFCG